MSNKRVKKDDQTRDSLFDASGQSQIFDKSFDQEVLEKRNSNALA